MKLKRTEVDELRKVLSYLYEDEKKHWEELDKPKDHIFLSVKKLTGALSKKGA